MPCVLSLIRKYLWKNKKRSLFLGLSIMISASIMTSLFLTIEDIKEERRTGYINKFGGDYDGEVSTANQEVLKRLDEMPMIEHKSSSIILSKGIKTTDTHLIQLIGFDNNAPSIFNLKLKDGKYPKDKREIALESWAVSDFNPVPKIGDKIKLKYTLKLNKQDPDIEMEDEFTLVGIFDHIYEFDKYKNISIGYVTEEYANDILVSKGAYKDDNIPHIVYMRLKPETNLEQAKSIFDKDEVFYAKFDSYRQEALHVLRVFDVIGKILYTIIAISTIIVIYNMFSASSMARTPEIGMLKAVGMSPTQILWLILGEGLVIGVIFIFVGILVGCGFYNLSVSLILGQSFSFNIFSISSECIKTCYIFGMSSVLLGSISSARRMSKLSAIEGINCYNYLDVKNVRFYDSKEIGGTTKKFLWDMSRFNVKRNKLRFIITVSSIVVSILLFVLSNYLVSISNPVVQFNKAFNCDFKVEGDNENPSISQGELDKIKNIKGVKVVEPAIRSKRFVNFTNCKDKVTKEGLETIYELSKRAINYKNAIDKNYFYMNAIQYGYEKSYLEKLKSEIKEGKIDIDLMEKEPVCILVQNFDYYDYTKFKVGDKINITDRTYMEPNKGHIFTIGAILKTDNYIQSDGMTYNEVILSNEYLRKNLNYNRYSSIKINVENKNDYDKVKEEIQKIINDNEDLTLKGYREELSKIKKNSFKLLAFLYSFIIITAITSIANIFAVMVMSVTLRKKEFAMLRAVGMSRGEVLKLIFNESSIYLASGGILGLGLGISLSYLLFIIIRKNLLKGMEWSFPGLTTLGIVGVVSIICLMVSFVASRKIFEDSVVDSIRAID